jgi:NADPH:quinone reductase-like Zn-dependent oxidoreductase
LKAIVLMGYGIPESFEEHEIPVPVLTETQVLVEMHASSISPGDIYLRSGMLQRSPIGTQFQVQFPKILGSDVAGIVRDVGKKVYNLKPGDRVMGLNPSGAYMDYIAMEEDKLTIIPDNISFEEAGAIPVVSLTAWQALFEYGNLQPGQRILIHGGAGGVGHAAIQLSKQHGAYVITTARECNRQFVIDMGADEVIDYTKTDFVNSISKPVDIVLDSVMMDKTTLETGLPGEFGNKNYAILKDAGKYVSIVAFAIGQYPKTREIDPVFFRAKPNATDLEAIANKIQEGKLTIHVDGNYPFTAQGLFQAYRKSELQPKRGKIVISKKM